MEVTPEDITLLKLLEAGCSCKSPGLCGMGLPCFHVLLGLH